MRTALQANRSLPLFASFLDQAKQKYDSLTLDYLLSAGPMEHIHRYGQLLDVCRTVVYIVSDSILGHFSDNASCSS